jgi:phenylacetate-CoA ligase
LPAGTGNTEMQVEAAAMLRPAVYAGTPDFLKIILDRAAETGHDLSSITGAVSGGALFPSLREEYLARGVRVMQCYATAEFGVIAYESVARTGTAAGHDRQREPDRRDRTAGNRRPRARW